jgi:hypothetical protein
MATAEKVDYLSMSDEDFLNAPTPAPEPAPADEAPAEDAGDEPTGRAIEAWGGDEEPEEDAEDADADEQGADDEGEDEAAPEGDADAGDQGDTGEPAGAAGDGPGDDVPGDKPGDSTPPADKPAESPALDYKALYERITSPFQANGKQMQVDNVDDAIRLMQMGANYNYKMAALKPNLRVLKTLEKAGLLGDESKLNFLLDLNQKKPEAIARLVKDSGIEPMDLKVGEADSYKAADHRVDEKEMALDAVIEEIRESPHYNRTLELVAKDWDATSKQLVVDSPELLKVLNDHMASGVFDVISTQLNKDRALGRLTGLSDFAAYKAVGDAIQERGGFDHLFKPKETTPDPVTAPVPPTPKADDAQLKDKRRAAGSPRTAAPPSGPAADYSPLAMSDEEFAKQFDSKYL